MSEQYGFLAQLQELLAPLHAALATTQETLTKQSEEIQLLRQELEAVKRSPPTPDIAFTAFPAPEQKLNTDTRVSERLPDPPPFTGKRKELPSFVSKLRYKLEGNADRFPTTRSKLLYAHSRLDDDAAALVRPLMDKDIKTVDQLLSFLEATYDDPNRRDTALTRIGNLRQGKHGFLTHFAEFRRLAADTGLNEIALIMQLKRSLSSELLRAMIGVKIPDNLNDYANLIVTYDNDLRYLPKAPTTSRLTPHLVKDPDAMDIDSVRHRYAPKGSSERQRREKEGLCFKCGEKGHLSPDCNHPMPPPRTTIRSSSTRNRSRGRRSTRSKSSSSTRSSRHPSKHPNVPSRQ
jgi:hypothetical protein